jgi:glycosyltransferase involved in cell wall biosynthesis
MALSGPEIGVVIPTYNRSLALQTALEHLARQSIRDFEVIVVDDGSTDDTAEVVRRFAVTAPYSLCYLHQPNSGPARARNQGIQVLNAPICLLIGDDIFASPRLLEMHLEFHRQHPALEAAAVGLTRWAEAGQVVTPLMRWLGSDGVQFAYNELLAGAAPTWKHFYTSNLSLKTAYLRSNPFHEGFPRAGMEDIELGYRLAKLHGLQMYFLPEAIADHLHSTTFARTCRRAIEGGESAYRFGQLWPEQALAPSRNLLKRWLMRLLIEPRVIMPTLRFVTNQLNRVWCPNPLLLPTLLVHERYGYLQQARRSNS